MIWVMISGGSRDIRGDSGLFIFSAELWSFCPAISGSPASPALALGDPEEFMLVAMENVRHEAFLVSKTYRSGAIAPVR